MNVVFVFQHRRTGDIHVLKMGNLCLNHGYKLIAKLNAAVYIENLLRELPELVEALKDPRQRLMTREKGGLSCDWKGDTEQ